MIEMVGKKFGRLLVISKALKRGQEPYWHCACDCGVEREVRGQHLRDGATTSCGCFHRERASLSFPKHGHSRPNPSPTYVSWARMRQRCRYAGTPGYKHYGGRGIKVCDRWNKSFENFLADMGERPEGKTLDRINVNGDYEPGNCRWATQSEQNRNTRRSRNNDHHDGVTNG